MSNEIIQYEAENQRKQGEKLIKRLESASQQASRETTVLFNSVLRNQKALGETPNLPRLKKQMLKKFNDLFTQYFNQ